MTALFSVRYFHLFSLVLRNMLFHFTPFKNRNIVNVFFYSFEILK